MGEAVIALRAVMELAEVLELEMTREALLIRVLNVKIDEFGVADVEADEGAMDCVTVSSAGDVELAVVGRSEVVNPCTVMVVDSNVADEKDEAFAMLVAVASVDAAVLDENICGE